MATMPSRLATFERALASIAGQVDRIYIYLDGHDRAPDVIRSSRRIVPVASSDVPDLHANGKLLGLTMEPGPFLFLSVDDDLDYSPNFVEHLRRGLEQFDDQAVVGLHGSLLARPLLRYNADRTVFAYPHRLSVTRPVDVLGTGAVMFSSEVLRFDVRAWPYVNMVDLGLAMEAAKVGIPLICLKRKRHLVRTLALNQPDSIYRNMIADDSRQTALAHELLRLRSV
jgi:hypothetical protein